MTVLKFPEKKTVPKVTPRVELGPGGSVAGATDAEVIRRAVEANPLRRMVTRRCACGHSWRQPAFTGLCPACGSDRVQNLGQIIVMAQRLK